MNLKQTTAFFSSAVVACILTTAGASSADYMRRYHASSCHASDDNVVRSTYVKLDSRGMYNSSTSYDAALLCDIQEDTAHPKDDVDPMFSAIVVDDSSNTVQVGACVAFASMTGGACGAFSATPPGHKSLTPYELPVQTQIWTDPAYASDIPYVNVLLPKATGGSTVIKGFEVSWPSL